jgi:hypothetical protein
MPVRLPSGETVNLTDGRAQSLLAIKVPLRVTCSSCSILVINGHSCHESGCPESWKDETRDCDECGCEFHPQERRQRFCGTDCANSHFGLNPDGE